MKGQASETSWSSSALRGTRRVARWCFVFTTTLMALGFAGCADDGDERDPAAPAPPTLVDQTFGAVDFVSGSAIAAFEICLEAEGGACAQSNEEGFALLQVPENGRYVVRLNADRYLGHLVYVALPGTRCDTCFYRMTMLSRSSLNLLARVIGADHAPENGLVAIGAVDIDGQSVGGMSVRGPGGDVVGPVYFGSNGLPDLDATSALPGTQAAFANVPPGQQPFTLEGVTLIEGPGNRFRVAGTESLEVPVEAGHLTIIQALVEPGAQ